MPTYQYRCTECGHDLEAVQKFSDASLTECPNCGGQLRKLFNAVGVVFKGSGFYRTDSRAGSGSESGAGEKVSVDASSKESGSKESGSKDSGSKESGAKETGAKETGAKDSGSKASGSKTSGSKESGSSTAATSGAKTPVSTGSRPASG